MNTLRSIVPWGLFLLMIFVAVLFWRQSVERAEELLAQRETIAQLEGQVRQVSNRNAALESDLERVQSALDAANRTVEDEGPPSSKAGDVGEDSPSPFDLGSLLESILDEEASDNGGMNPFSAIMNMFDGPQGEQMMKMGVDMMLDMQFADFFNMLSPEAAGVAREILSDYMLHTSRNELGAFGAETDWEEVAARMEAARQDMLTQLRTSVGAEGAALYEQYEKELPAKMMDQSLEMQLGMFAGTLSPETRDLVRHTMVEEMLALQPEEAAPVPGSLRMQEELRIHDEAYGRALDRLEPYLTQEEFDVVHRFVEQQQQMTDMFSSMMGIEEDSE